MNDIPLGFLTHWEFSVLPAHNAGIKGGAHVAPFFFIVLPNIKTSARLLVYRDNPVNLTDPTDDMQTDLPNLHVRSL